MNIFFSFQLRDNRVLCDQFSHFYNFSLLYAENKKVKIKIYEKIYFLSKMLFCCV
jgi:hypothetical protein